MSAEIPKKIKKDFTLTGSSTSFMPTKNKNGEIQYVAWRGPSSWLYFQENITNINLNPRHVIGSENEITSNSFWINRARLSD